LEGEGKMVIRTKCIALPKVTGATGSVKPLAKELVLNFASAKTHTVKVDMTCRR
jgi:hypothetical protein